MISQEELFGKCPYATAQKVLSGKWSIVIMHILSERTYRFNELQHQLPDITQATLTKQLRYLEEYGLVVRTVFPQIPPKVEYSLSEIGREFSGVLASLEIWGKKYINYYRTNKNESE
jgi:DNA-binding HxlR family transcriptional regulator